MEIELGVTKAPVEVLLVEDDAIVAGVQVEALRVAGYHVRHATTSAAAIALLDGASSHWPHLAVVDLMLPDGDGLLRCATIKRRANTPVIICSATRRHRDQLLAFGLGADDFLPKPVDLDEFVARVGVVLRRVLRNGAQSSVVPAGPQETVDVGDLVVDEAGRKVLLGGQPVPLSPAEYRLLVALARQPETVHSPEELAQLISDGGGSHVGDAIKSCIWRLRSKLTAVARQSGAALALPEIVAVRGFGYMLTAPLQGSESSTGRHEASASPVGV